MFSEISELKSVREQKCRCSARERELTTPQLTDLELIPVIYGWFREILSHRSPASSWGSVAQRKKFIFIILYLYSPGTLVGVKMVNGLRDKISEVVNINSRSTISDNCVNALFMYQNYKSFRSDIENIYAEIMKRLGQMRLRE